MFAIKSGRKNAQQRILEKLEADGLATRMAHATIPPKVEYELSPVGRSLIEPLQAIVALTKRNRSIIESSRKPTT